MAESSVDSDVKTPFRISIPSAGGYDKLVREAMPEDWRSMGAHSSMLNIPEDEHLDVEVHATGVNFADVVIRHGLYESAKEFVGWPITPGFEFSGTVSDETSKNSVSCRKISKKVGQYGTQIRIIIIF